MNQTFDNLKNFFIKIKEINLWQRIFSWKTIRVLSYDAYDEFRLLLQNFENYNMQLEQYEQTITNLEKSNEILKPYEATEGIARAITPCR